MRRFLKKYIDKFMNQSLEVKSVSLLVLLIAALGTVSVMIFGRVLSDDYEEQIMVSKSETLVQIASNIDGSLYDILEEMIFIREDLQSIENQYQFEEDGTAYLNNDILYREYFNEMVSRGNNYELVDSMIVLTKNESHFFSVNAAKSIDREDLLSKIEKDYKPKAPCIWTGEIEGTYYTSSYEKKIYSIIMPVNGTGAGKTCLIVNLSSEQMQKYLERLGNGGERLLLDCGTGSVYAGEGEKSTIEENNEIQALIKEKGSIKEGKDYVVLAETLKSSRWSVYMICLKDEMKVGLFAISTSLLLLILAAGVVIFIIGYFVVYFITKPLNKITKIIVANGQNPEFPERFSTKYKDEVGVMGEAYNHMMDEIHGLMENIAEEQQQNKRNYLKLLQLQIKPHFLYNSLEATRFLVEMKDENAVEMIDAIGRFYKLSLSGVQDIVSLAEEKEHLTCYMKILKLRYNSKYNYEILIPVELEEYEIVKFSLQPLVENAVYHGVKMRRSRGRGFVRIWAEAEQDEIEIHVWDNGAGIQKEKLEEIRRELRDCDGRTKREHIGIVNVHQRIKMFFAGDYGVTIDSEEGVYTDVHIRIPKRKYKGEGEDV